VRVIVVCGLCLLGSALLAATAWAPPARWGTGAVGPPGFRNEQVCRDGVTWRYAEAYDARPVAEQGPWPPIPPTLTLHHVEASGQAGRLAGPIELTVPLQPFYVDPALLGSDSIGWIPGYAGLFTHHAISTLEFNKLVSPTSKIDVTWAVFPGFALPEWGVDKCYLIDLEPGSFPNEVNPRGGRVDVAILSTPKFKAKKIRRSSVRLGADGATADARAFDLIDVDDDGDRDLVGEFRVRDTGIDCSSTEVRLRARLKNDAKVRGHDSVTPVGC
jgi:hypothetical protein